MCIRTSGKFSKSTLGDAEELLEDGDSLLCESIQFAVGLAVVSENLMISFGVNDCESNVVVIPTEEILGRIRPFTSNHSTLDQW